MAGIFTRNMKKLNLNGFNKWLKSSKFQIALIAIILIYISMEIFNANPDTALPLVRDVALGYFGARVAEPVVEFAVKRLGKKIKTDREVSEEGLEGDE